MANPACSEDREHQVRRYDQHVHFQDSLRDRTRVAWLVVVGAGRLASTAKRE